MKSKSMKGGNAPRVAVPKPLTEEEKRFKLMQFLQQKREQFALNILCNLCQNYPETLQGGKALVNTSIDMADHLMEKLYPTGEESDKSNN